MDCRLRVSTLPNCSRKLLRKDAKQDSVCDKCTDERKDKPVLGMNIIRGAKKSEGKDVWEGGKILDPDNGKEYTLRLTPIEGGVMGAQSRSSARSRSIATLN